MQLYTVDRKGSLTANQTIQLISYDDIKPPCLQEHANKLFPDGVSAHGELYMLRGNTPAKGVNAAIELLYEYVRRSFYPDRPSRFQSMFAVEDYQAAVNFRTRFNNNEGAIWKINCDSIFRADMNLLHLQCSLLALSYNATQYWNGQPSNNPFWEYLLRPPIRIIEKITENVNG